MEIRKITLKNFRNYSQKSLSFLSGVTLIIGDNAAGKTNLLEAIFLLATGKSFRIKGVESEMIRTNSEIGSVKGETTKDSLEVILTRGEVMREKTAKKRYLLNGVAKRASDFIGNLRVVYFGPEDLDLVVGSPSIRRKYLDLVLSQTDREYARAVLSYEKGLRARNKILESMRELGLVDRRKLFFWDQLLIKNGNQITQKREEFLEFVNRQPLIADCQFLVEYDRSVISESRLAQYEKEEVAAGSTLVGPHRDDFIVQARNSNSETRNLSIFGSRGEQRLAVLWLKLAELRYLKEKTQEMPVLLLDDIFSELDARHRCLIFEAVSGQQTIITSADRELTSEEWLKGANLLAF